MKWAFGYRKHGALGIPTHFELFPRHLTDKAFSDEWELLEFAREVDGWEGSETSTFLIQHTCGKASS